MKLNSGTYKLELTKKSLNLYKVDGQDIYILTKYCLEMAYGDDIILEVESSYGLSKGELIFVD